MFFYFCYFIVCLSVSFYANATQQVPPVGTRTKVGIDCLMEEQYSPLLSGKKIGLITNHTAINSQLQSTIEVLKAHQSTKGYQLVALFAPEHGIDGSIQAAQEIRTDNSDNSLPIYSLYGETLRPTDDMLKGINLLIFDIQDIGTRSYTYISTMFYAMEEAAKRKIPFMVLDRPNPINGITVDGPMLEEKWRSITGYINVPYCHGMTIGELAQYFNGEYKIGCQLKVIPMRNWRREMTFAETGLHWIPTSPYVPEATTPFFYPITGVIGEFKFVNIGIGYTLPFKVIGAPWIAGKQLAEQLNAQKFPGVYFKAFHYRPMFGRCAHKDCEGVLILITNPLTFRPIAVQYLILGMLKNLYPNQFKEAITNAKKFKKTLCQLYGTEEIFRIIVEEKNIVWKLCEVHKDKRENFLKKRKKYLLTEYGKLAL